MNKLRLIDARPEIAEVTGYCATGDDRLVQVINEVGRRLSRRGKWVGTTVRYRILVNDCEITWPRQVTTIEAIAFCDCPGEVRNGWYEFLGHGPGLLSGESGCWHQLIDRGTAPVFDTITVGEVNRKLRVYADVAESAGLKLTVQGYDENSNWIRTQVDGVWIDGEQITISITPQLSAKYFTSITGVFKPATNGAIRLYEYNFTTAANVKMLGYYEPDETVPIYRRSLLPGGTEMANCGDCENAYVTVAVKLRYIPAVNDNDWLMLGNLDALKLGAQAVMKERGDLQAEAEGYWGKALRELDHELAEYQGDGVLNNVRVQWGSEWGGGGIACI